MNNLISRTIFSVTTLCATNALTSSQYPPEGYEEPIVHNYRENRATGKMLLDQNLADLEQLVEMGILKPVQPQIEEIITNTNVPEITSTTLMTTVNNAPELTFQQLINLISFGNDFWEIPDGYQYFESGITTTISGNETNLDDIFRGEMLTLSDSNIRSDFSFLTKGRILSMINDLIGKQIILYKIPGLELPVCLIKKNSIDQGFLNEDFLKSSLSIGNDIENSDIIKYSQLRDCIDKVELALTNLENAQDDKDYLVEKADRYITRLKNLYNQYEVMEENLSSLERYTSKLNSLLEEPEIEAPSIRNFKTVSSLRDAFSDAIDLSGPKIAVLDFDETLAIYGPQGRDHPKILIDSETGIFLEYLRTKDFSNIIVVSTKGQTQLEAALNSVGLSNSFDAVYGGIRDKSGKIAQHLSQDARDFKHLVFVDDQEGLCQNVFSKTFEKPINVHVNHFFSVEHNFGHLIPMIQDMTGNDYNTVKNNLIGLFNEGGSDSISRFMDRLFN